MLYSTVVFSGDCHTKTRRETVNSPAVKNGFGHGLEKWSYQRPAEAPPLPWMMDGNAGCHCQLCSSGNCMKQLLIYEGATESWSAIFSGATTLCCGNFPHWLKGGRAEVCKEVGRRGGSSTVCVAEWHSRHSGSSSGHSKLGHL